MWRMLVVVVGLGGCSYAMTSPRPARLADGTLACSSRTAPAVDTVLTAAAIVLGALGKSASSQSDSCLDCSSLSLSPLMETAIGVAIFAPSAVYGFVAVSRCETRVDSGAPEPDIESDEAHELRLMKNDAIEAARNGSCKVVAFLHRRIVARDPAFAAREVDRDPGVAACLASASPSPNRP